MSETYYTFRNKNTERYAGLKYKPSPDHLWKSIGWCARAVAKFDNPMQYEIVEVILTTGKSTPAVEHMTKKTRDEVMRSLDPQVVAKARLTEKPEVE